MSVSAAPRGDQSVREQAFAARLLTARREHLTNVESDLTYVPDYSNIEDCRLLSPNDEGYANQKTKYVEILKKEIAALENYIS